MFADTPEQYHPNDHHFGGHHPPSRGQGHGKGLGHGHGKGLGHGRNFPNIFSESEQQNLPAYNSNQHTDFRGTYFYFLINFISYFKLRIIYNNICKTHYFLLISIDL